MKDNAHNSSAPTRRMRAFTNWKRCWSNMQRAPRPTTNAAVPTVVVEATAPPAVETAAEPRQESSLHETGPERIPDPPLFGGNVLR
ncbi:hypothetical protein N7535_003720 [Penicillium sp. DV-2018c]|nr:hypothetical protein N7535_003720 [Penicillium sp. DV-2018c]